MRDSSGVIEHFATILQSRGIAAILCGVGAMMWPDELLLHAMLFTGVIFATSGLYEASVAWQSRHLNRGWPLALADGAACFGMAVISATFAAVPFRATVVFAALWLFACGAFSLALGFATWPMRRTRLAMLVWSVAQLALATVAIFDAGVDLVLLLYVGAGYTVGFGVFQVAAARWMRRVAVPQFEATIQHHWLVTGAQPRRPSHGNR